MVVPLTGLARRGWWVRWLGTVLILQWVGVGIPSVDDVALLWAAVESLRREVVGLRDELIRVLVEDALAGGAGCEPSRAEYRRVLLQIRDVLG